MTTAVYRTSDGALLGYTRAANPGPQQIPDPLPDGTATVQVETDPARPPTGQSYQWDAQALDWQAVTLPMPDTLTPDELLDIITPAEQVAIHVAANDPNTTAANRAKLQSFLLRVSSQQRFRRSSPAFEAAVAALEAGGLISAETASALRGV